MCEPLSAGAMTALMIGGISTAAVGTGISAYGMVASGEAQAEQAAAQADAQRRTAEQQRLTAEANKKAQAESAISVQNIAAQQAAAKKLQTRQLIGQQIAAGGASGINPLTGTAADIQAETRQAGELDALRIANNAQRQAWGMQTQSAIDYSSAMSGASQMDFSATQREAAGRSARTAGYIGAGGSILSGLGSIGMSAAKFGGGTKASISEIASISEMNNPNYGWG